jgi:aarF domain-containing kinase
MKPTLPRPSPQLIPFRALRSSLRPQSPSPSTHNWQLQSCHQNPAPQRTFHSHIFSTSKRRYHSQNQRRFFSERSLSREQSYRGDAGRGSETNKDGNSSRKRTAIKIAAAGGTLGAAAFAFSDDFKHGYAAAARTGRVVSALAVCINE